MKRIIFCIALNLFSLSYFAQAQSRCRVISPDADEWVGNNREKITKMTRPEWQELEDGYKWRVFIELSAKQKHDFFRLKMKQVIDSLEWNKEEKEHLDNLYQLFVDNPDMYNENKDEKKFAEINEFLKKWVTDAMEKLQWTPQLIQGMLNECEDLLDKTGNVRVTVSSKMLDLKGTTAPDFTLTNLAGVPVSLSNMRGKYIVLDFWGSWCSPCMGGMPVMKRYYEQHKDKLEFVGIACNDKDAEWRNAVDKNELNWVQLKNNDNKDATKNVSLLYSVGAYPTKFILDKDLKILAIFQGESVDFYTKLDTLLINGQ